MNRLNQTRAYLSGAMEVCDDNGVGWRREITPRLRSYGITVFDPTNKPTEVKEDPEIRNKIQKFKEEGNWVEAVKLCKSFCRLDLRMVDLSNFLIVYVDTDIFMFGTVHEYVLAIQQRKPVLVVCKQGKTKISNWVIATCPHQHIFNNFEEMFSYLDYINTSDEIEFEEKWQFFNFV